MTAEPPPPSLDDDPMRAVACARPPLFELDDADGWAAALEHDGFAVIANIVAPALRAELVEQFWAEFVAACRELPEASPLARVARGDDATWPRVDAFGRKSRHAPMHLAQADFLWRLRADPAVARAFARVHGVARADELVASLDSYSLHMRGQPARGLALHDDQARGVDGDAARADSRSVQGAVNLFAVTAGDAGLVVVPGSHRRWDRRRAGARGARNQLHHVPLRRDFDAAQWAREHAAARKLLLPPGCLVLWNSRLLHGTAPGARAARPAPPGGGPPRLNRLTCFVCLMPRRLRSREARAAKEALYRAGGMTSHWATHADVHPCNAAGPLRGRLEPDGSIPKERLALL